MNILHHTSFDEGFSPYPGQDNLLVPSGWHPVWVDGEKPGPVRPEIQPEIRSQGDKGIRTGEHGLKLAHAWSWFDAALYMQFAASPGLKYMIAAYVTAESDAGLACRVGIDPKVHGSRALAGADRASLSIVWSDWHGTDNDDFAPYQWKQVAAEAEAAGDLVTVFLRCACRDPVQVNAGFFDDVTFYGEEYRPPTDRCLLDLIDGLVLDVAGLREYVEQNKQQCLLV